MKFVVTGATGFLGQYVVEDFLENGHQVLALGRNQKILSRLQSLGAQVRNVDLARIGNSDSFIEEGDIVIHAAARSAPWGPYDLFHQDNVVATENLVRQSLQKKAARFVHISTPSIYGGDADRENIFEEDPLPETFINHYATTKQLAEKIVDAAFAKGLPTVTLRPQAIIGPRDQTLLPRILRLAKRGVVPVIGKCRPRMDITLVENVVRAIALASLTENVDCFGQKFNITNDEPVLFHDFVGEILNRLSHPFREVNVPLSVANGLAESLDFVWRTLPLAKEPPLTNYAIHVLCKSRTLNTDKAKRLLGYRPITPLSTGLQNLVEWIRMEGLLNR